ncbi:MAG TPA: AAA family ATPase, partial [Candidatus Nanopelagicales bacterium]|nr:AAA family ATPase [Candidatus Nanopelagicales bacterium]
MVTFDEVLPTLVRVCEAAPGFTALRRCCVVRDLHGRVRLVVDPDPAASAPTVDLAALTTALGQELESYFAGPIWSTGAKGRDEARLSGEIFKRPETEIWEAIYDDPATGQRGIRSLAPWRKMERRLSKQGWLEAGKANAPWELGEGPAIVTFYSFKGGVGRTTALCACAWQLASSGKRVAVIDLDLEAPGLGSLLEGEGARGVVDFLADHIATGRARVDELIAPARALGDDEERVQVLAAGTLGPTYLEKLARLDYVTADAGKSDDAASSPVEHALRELLFALRRQKPQPDYILIDSRAGLHDLA